MVTALRTIKTPEDRRAEIIDGAYKVFCKHGFDHVSMDQVAYTLGISKALLYYYYGSRCELIDAVILHAAQSGNQPLLQMLDGNRTFYEKLAFLLYTFRPGTNKTVEAFLAACGTGGERERFLARLADLTDDAVERLVEDGLQQDIIQNKNQPFVALLLVLLSIRRVGDRLSSSGRLDGVSYYLAVANSVEHALGLPPNLLTQEMTQLITQEENTACSSL